MRKYELLENDTIEPYGSTLYRIKALRDFNNVKAGEIGGYIEKEDNLSHEGDCWVYDDAMVIENAKIYDNAQIYNNVIHSNTEIYGCATIHGKLVDAGPNVKIYGNTELPKGNVLYIHNSVVYGNTKILGNTHLAFADISNVCLSDCTLLGLEDKNLKVSGDTDHLFLSGVWINGADAKIHNYYDYGKIDGFGITETVEFYRLKDNTIIIFVFGRMYTLEDFKVHYDTILHIEPNQPKINSLIEFIESYMKNTDSSRD